MDEVSRLTPGWYASKAYNVSPFIVDSDDGETVRYRWYNKYLNGWAHEVWTPENNVNRRDQFERCSDAEVSDFLLSIGGT